MITQKLPEVRASVCTLVNEKYRAYVNQARWRYARLHEAFVAAYLKRKRKSSYHAPLKNPQADHGVFKKKKRTIHCGGQ